MRRYDKLLQLIDIFQPQTIVEVGTWNGDNAIRMIKAAERYWDCVSYTGFDLFEEATDETDQEEFNVKQHNLLSDVRHKIVSACPSARVELIKGNTNETLDPQAPLGCDFAYIDGGHSIATISHDHTSLRNASVIVHDDYYMADDHGKMPDISKYGCNKLIDNIPHALIDTRDQVADGGYVCLAMVLGGK